MRISGCLQVSATVHFAIINTVVHVSFLMGVFVLSGYKPSGAIPGSYDNFIFSFVFFFFFKIHNREGD